MPSGCGARFPPRTGTCRPRDARRSTPPLGPRSNRGLAGSPAVYDRVTGLADELTQAPSDAQTESLLIDIARHVRSLPEAERRARLYELVMWLGLVDPA